MKNKKTSRRRRKEKEHDVLFNNKKTFGEKRQKEITNLKEKYKKNTINALELTNLKEIKIWKGINTHGEKKKHLVTIYKI